MTTNQKSDPSRLKTAFAWLKQPKHFIPVIVGMVIIGYGGYRYYSSHKTVTPQYQTATVEKGSLIESVTASGNITTGNNLTIATTATGTVKNVFVKDGDVVKVGQKIAEIELDQDSLQRQTAAYASYLSAKNSLASAQANLHSLQSKEFAANQTFIKGAVANNDSTSDPTYIQQNADWLAAEAAYVNQQGVINQAQTSVQSAWLNYQQVASTITAPKSGVISNLTISQGSVISPSTTSSSGTAQQQELGSISDPNGKNQAVVDISEIDAVNVKPGQKVTMTMDAFPDKTYTGKVLVVNTNGQVSSGVTTYPATIVFDTSSEAMYPNMAVNATIITNLKNDVVMVPSAAIQSNNGQNTVRILKNGQVTSVDVTTGLANDTQTEIVAGVNEGDTVITSVSSNATTQTSTTTSPFSAFGGGGRVGGGGGAAGGAVRRLGGD